jgi:hypothetical protein
MMASTASLREKIRGLHRVDETLLVEDLIQQAALSDEVKARVNARARDLVSVFVLPPSNATKYLSFFVNPPLLLPIACHGRGELPGQTAFQISSALLARRLNALRHMLRSALHNAVRCDRLHVGRHGL